MILKSRELERSRDSGLSFWGPSAQAGLRGGQEGNQMFRANKALGSMSRGSFGFLPGCEF